jgi:hypothetical protein
MVRVRHVGSPYRSFRQKGRKAAKPPHGGTGMGGGKKRKPSCHETDTGCARGLGNITRRASGQTSLRCLGTRTMEESIQKVLQMTVASGHWCSLPRKGIDVCQVSCSQQVVGLLTGLSQGL